MNKVILLGRLPRDPEVRYTQSAEPMSVVSFGIAVNRAFKRDGEQDVDFINCVCFGKRGENIVKFFKKGNHISVVGRLQVRNWQDNNGQKRQSTDVVIEEFDFCESKGESADSGGYSLAQTLNNVQPNVFYHVEDSVGDDGLPF